VDLPWYPSVRNLISTSGKKGFMLFSSKYALVSNLHTHSISPPIFSKTDSRVGCEGSGFAQLVIRPSLLVACWKVIDAPDGEEGETKVKRTTIPAAGCPVRVSRM
jgi:hypothetical protein